MGCKVIIDPDGIVYIKLLKADNIGIKRHKILCRLVCKSLSGIQLGRFVAIGEKAYVVCNYFDRALFRLIFPLDSDVSPGKKYRRD